MGDYRISKLSDNRLHSADVPLIGSRLIGSQPAAPKRLPTWMKSPLSCLLLLVLCGCLSTAVEVDEDTEFPVPLVHKIPLKVGMHLPPELLDFVHQENLGDDGSFTIDISDAQPGMFRNLFVGMFDDVTVIEDPAHPGMEVAGTIVPRITELQFSTPSQTRTDYFEVWLKYQFELYNRDGDRLGDWFLTAYGKANTQNYGLNKTPPTLRAAALQACRDAMAYFTVSFVRESIVQQWLAAELTATPHAALDHSAAEQLAAETQGDF